MIQSVLSVLLARQTLEQQILQKQVRPILFLRIQPLVSPCTVLQTRCYIFAESTCLQSNLGDF